MPIIIIILAAFFSGGILFYSHLLNINVHVRNAKHVKFINQNIIA